MSAMSAQKALQESKMETRDLLEATKEYGIFPNLPSGQSNDYSPKTKQKQLGVTVMS